MWLWKNFECNILDTYFICEKDEDVEENGEKISNWGHFSITKSSQFYHLECFYFTKSVFMIHITAGRTNLSQ